MDNRTPPTSSSGLRRAWVVRPPRLAAEEKLSLDTGLLLVDFGVRQDLSDHLEFEQILDEVEQANPGESRTRIDSMARQLDILLNHMQPGDLVLSPMRRTGCLAIGQMMPGYTEGPGEMPARQVRWLKADVAKAAVQQDLLHSMGAYQRVYEITRNDLPRRIEAMLAHGRDPGPEGAVDLPQDSETLARMLRARAAAHIGSAFSGHRMAELVAAILEAEGYRCRVSPPGPDGGVDILAGQGPLGMSGAKIVIQVKSGDIVADEETLQSLMGAMRLTGCDTAILVAWSGVTRPVQARLRDLWFTCRLWDAGEILDRILANYDRLPQEMKVNLPIRMAPIFG